MSEWDSKYEKEIKCHPKEQNYVLKTINEFTSLNEYERKILKLILANKGIEV